MRTLAIIMSVLAITAVAYGFDVDQSRKWNNNLKKCKEDLGGSPSEDVVLCAAKKDGKILDANGEYVKAETLQRIEDLISDANKVKVSQTLFSLCYDDVVGSGARGNEQTTKLIACAISILGVID